MDTALQHAHLQPIMHLSFAAHDDDVAEAVWIRNGL